MNVNTGWWSSAFAKRTAADKEFDFARNPKILAQQDPCTNASRLRRQKHKSRKSELSNITVPARLTGGGQKEPKTSRVALFSRGER